MKKILLTTIIVLLAVALNAQVSVWDGTAEPWTKGSGTPDDPYLIESAQNFAYLAEKTNEYYYGEDFRIIYVDTCFLLTVNLDLGADQGYMWNPVANNGNISHSVSFGGHFDGGNHSISNITMSNQMVEYFGVFGHIVNGSLKNIIIDGDDIHIPNISSIFGGCTGIILGFGINVTVENCVNNANIICDAISMSSLECILGGMFGSMIHSTILNCHNYGDITATNELMMYSGLYCGGVAAFLRACEMNNCSNYGDVYIMGPESEACSRFVNSGGIAGFATGTIANCNNNGDMYLDLSVGEYTNLKVIGGIVGHTSSDYGGQLIVTNCYCISELNLVGDMYPSWGGGILGSVGGSIPVSIENSYYAGSRILTDYTGGIVAIANNSTTIDNCYYLNTIESGNDYGTPKSEDEMKSEEFIGLLNADEEVFFMDTYGYLNDGFPILKWQHESHVGVDETDWQGNVAVYPNPVQSVLTVSGENLKELVVINILGQPVLKTPCSGESVIIDLAGQPAGVYFIKITDKNGNKYSEKVVKD